MIASHAQLFRDAFHALSLGCFGFAMFGQPDDWVALGYTALGVALHGGAHAVIRLNAMVERKRAEAGVA